LTLFELARELFTYLVRFREKASSTSAPPLPEVRRDLLGIFARMENHAKRDPLLLEPYHQVHYALVALADEVVLTSGWEHAPAWRQALLEERFYNSQHAGSRFFEQARNLDNAPQDVVAIFYLCLALGFSGRFAPADPELAEVKESLLARLPSKPRIMEEPDSRRTRQDRRLRGWLWSAAVVVVLLAAVIIGWPQWQKRFASKPSPSPAPSAQSDTKKASPTPTPPAKAAKEIQVAASKAGNQPVKKSKASPTLAKPASPKSSAPAKEKAGLPKPAAPVAPKTAAQPEVPAKPALPSASVAETAKQKTSSPSSQPPASPAAKAAPATPAAVQAAPQATPTAKTYRVRVGVYVGPIQSGRFTDKLKSAGYAASVEKLDRPGGKALYVVSITPIADRAEAEKIQAEVKDKFKVQGVIKEN
jgi:type IV/VI secretion system ImpK/VasF family protein